MTVAWKLPTLPSSFPSSYPDIPKCALMQVKKTRKLQVGASAQNVLSHVSHLVNPKYSLKFPLDAQVAAIAQISHKGGGKG